MENLVFIQSENFGKSDYLFVGNKLISDKNEVMKIIDDKFNLKDHLLFSLVRKESSNTEVKKKFPFGFLIQAQLNEREVGGRFMGLTCLYNGDISNLDFYLNDCLKQIDKSINSSSLKIIKNSLSNYTLIRNIILTITMAIVAYLIFKIIN